MPSATASASIAGLIVFGTLASLLGKIVYELSGEDFSGHDKLFRKPWATTTFMFIGMSFCLPLGWILDYVERRQEATTPEEDKILDAEPLLAVDQAVEGAAENGKKRSDLQNTLLLAIPTMFDLTATILMSVGLLYVTASVYQMLRGAELLFAAIFSVTFLKRSLNRNNIIGIACCLVGICGVGFSSVLSGQGSASADITQGEIMLGMGLIVLSQGVQAAQVTVEDYVMRDVGTAPLQVVGYEGVFGVLAMVCVLLPIVQHTPYQDGTGLREDTWETLHIIRHSTTLPYMVPTLVISLLCYNIAGMFVTDEIGAVARTVLETMRTLFVWMVDLILFYTPLGLGRLGEKWDKFSFLQLAGFIVLFAGTVIYGRGEDKSVEDSKEAMQSAHPHLRWHAAVNRLKDLRRPMHRSTFGIVSLARAHIHSHHHAKAADAHRQAMQDAAAA